MEPYTFQTEDGGIVTFNEEAALEKFVFQQFKTKYTTWKRSNIPNLLVRVENLQLPNNSVYHVVDQFLQNKHLTISPDLNDTFIKNEKFTLYLWNQLALPEKESRFFIDDNLKYRPQSFTSEIQNFFKKHHNVKRSSMLASMLNKSNVLPIVNYNAITTAQPIGGKLQGYRTFEAILKTILDTTVKIDHKLHYIHIPISSIIYKRSSFTTTMKEINYQNLKFKNCKDFTYYFLIHLFNFVSRVKEKDEFVNATSLFNELTVPELDRTNIILTAGDKAIIYNLGDMRHMFDKVKDTSMMLSVMKHITNLQLAGHMNIDTDNLDEHGYDKIVETQGREDDDTEDNDITEHTEITDEDKNDIPKDQNVSSLKANTNKLIKLIDIDNLTELETLKEENQDEQQIIDIEDDDELDLLTNKPMTRVDIIKKMKIFNKDSLEKLVICSSGAMVMHNLIDTTNDLDIHSSDESEKFIKFIEHLLKEKRSNNSLSKDTFIKANRFEIFFGEKTIKKIILNSEDDVLTSETGIRYLNLHALERWYTWLIPVSKDKEKTIKYNHYLVIIRNAIKVQGKDIEVQELSDNIPSSIIDNQAVDYINNYPNLSEAQQKRLKRVAQIYKGVKLNNKSLSEHIDATPDVAISKNKLNFLKDHVLDESMLSSSAIKLDEHYINENLYKDIANVALHFHSVGLFLTDIEESEEISRINRVKRFKFTYEDMEGKKHKVVFKLPIVSDDGIMLANGIKSRMIKQEVNVPICKVAPNRVSLASNYNKTIVERNKHKVHSFRIFIQNYIANIYKSKIGLTIVYGALKSPTKLPYEYTCVADKFSQLITTNYQLFFDLTERFDFVKKILEKDKVIPLEKKYGVCCGMKNKNLLFFGFDNVIHEIDLKTNTEVNSSCILDILVSEFKGKMPLPKVVHEWTELKILDKNFPIIFIMGFQYGLTQVLKQLKIDYTFYTEKRDIPKDKLSSIIVPFSDGYLVFDRYPIEKSLIVSGLLKYNTSNFELKDLNEKDAYYVMLLDNGEKVNYLKGITDNFDFFIDTITRDTLKKMNMPTDFFNLLVKATEMLSYDYAIQTSSMRNLRTRGYERLVTVLYNHMARSYATYRNQRVNKKSFSINPDAVFYEILNDQSVQLFDEINPIHEIQDKLTVTYAGQGGRTAQSFMVDDRTYPEDGVGVLSECTPDSGKVAIKSYLSVDPVINDIRGTYDLDSVDLKKIKATQVLSLTSMLMPCAINEDRKLNETDTIRVRSFRTAVLLK